MLCKLVFLQVLSCKLATVASNAERSSKIVCSADDAVRDIPDGAKLLVGGKCIWFLLRFTEVLGWYLMVGKKSSESCV